MNYRYVENGPSRFRIEKYAKPVCLRHYPVPKVHGYMFEKEVERLISLGILEIVNDSKWGAQYFAEPKPRINRV